MATRDELGKRGEAIFYVHMTKFHGQSPLFRVQFLGDKWPAIDFVVELISSQGRSAYFFAQARATRRGYVNTKRGRRLNVTVKRSDLVKLASYPAPTYVVGIDDVGEKAYVVSTVGTRLRGAASLPTTFELTATTRQELWTEVETFWRASGATMRTSRFIEPEWR
jgi:hypothetical protein